jgi:hypothetical protein
MGIHLGNRPGIGWNDIEDDDPPGGFDFLERLRGNRSTGKWPAVVVVLSDQVFDLTRSPAPPCLITRAAVSQTRDHVFRFITQANQNADTQVLIRIVPSPGNFLDADDTNLPHQLSSDPERAAGGDYCNDENNSVAGKGRDVSDIMAEMNAIMEAIDRWNTRNPDARLNKEDVFFIPANEPNLEWYIENSLDPLENRSNPQVWGQMDAYFTTLYNFSTRRSDVQILTPAMGPWAFAEPLNAGCQQGTFAGYDLMSTTYDTSNDGYVWNNYWDIGKEAWGDGDPCPMPNQAPDSHHLFQFFPAALQARIRDQGKPTFISEASQRLDAQEIDPLTGLVPSKDDRPRQIRDSTWQFVAEESAPGRGAQYIALWLLTQDLLRANNPDVVNRAATCADLDYNPFDQATEIPWHMAYLPDATLCEWFEITWR